MIYIFNPIENVKYVKKINILKRKPKILEKCYSICQNSFFNKKNYSKIVIQDVKLYLNK
jgi:hypothetical protein